MGCKGSRVQISALRPVFQSRLRTSGGLMSGHISPDPPLSATQSARNARRRCLGALVQGATTAPERTGRGAVLVAFLPMTPIRSPLFDFPDVLLHADELAVKRHPKFRAAKAGDVEAAEALASHLASSVAVERLAGMLEGRLLPELVPIHALETEGVNQIPAALANVLSRLLGLPVNTSIVQLNSVGHTGADGFKRLANQALFAGAVVRAQHTSS